MQQLLSQVLKGTSGKAFCRFSVGLWIFLECSLRKHRSCRSLRCHGDSFETEQEAWVLGKDWREWECELLLAAKKFHQRSTWRPAWMIGAFLRSTDSAEQFATVCFFCKFRTTEACLQRRWQKFPQRTWLKNQMKSWNQQQSSNLRGGLSEPPSLAPSELISWLIW